ncbi:hypothetical protein P152DRAFT_463157 [Eremomyces bilateralis CBS 781.70]|uniref:Uncharacterized protein n=1 Tax=Eremomyces bilateralis CBS 781.70 TaxID=1392243 RepID=A0A6G1FPU9_9PEZI|nr:uncharacterized protein P152DRAFT_463157 [Eremomyces bilateralis CBS 781.70]KAF1807824.1 hypothetical protein P152DRAFT_463157 [Eremomyces bilateralis CBS 781.70]
MVIVDRLSKKKRFIPISEITAPEVATTFLEYAILLPIAEFESNSSKNISTNITPFKLTKGYIPRASFKPPISDTEPRNKEVRDTITMKDDHVYLDTRFLKLSRPSKGLDLKHIGPFKLLYLDDGIPLPGQNIPPAPAKIVNCRFNKKNKDKTSGKKGTLQYKAHYKG